MKLAREGRLAGKTTLVSLLGSLGLVRATGVLQLERRKLIRRLVLVEGRIAAIVSNAQDDRLAEWVLANEKLRSDRAQRLATLAGQHAALPLTRALLAQSALFDESTLDALARRHAHALLLETSRLKDLSFRIAPGRLDLGQEPPLDWPALDAALAIGAALMETSRARTPRLPPWVGLNVGLDALAGVSLSDAQKLVLAACAEPRSTARLPAELAGAERREAEDALALLYEANLIVEEQAPKPKVAADSPEAGAPVDARAVEAWLAAVEREDFNAILEVPPGADSATIRRSYYRTVRRFHPDRFREGALSAYYEQVERAFPLVQDALEVLTDPEARARRERAKKGSRRTDGAALARGMMKQARQAAADGNRAESAALLERGLSSLPGAPELRFALGVLLLGNPARRGEGAELLAKLAEEYPQQGDYLAGHALAMLREGRDDEAAALAQGALSKAPGLPLALAVQGDAGARRSLLADPFLGPLFR